MGDLLLNFLRIAKAIIDLILAGMSEDDAIKKVAKDNGLSRGYVSDIFDKYGKY